MKKLLLSVPIFIGSISLYGQDSTTTGHVHYKRVTDISENEFVQNRPDIPTEIITEWDLYFTPEESYFVYHPEEAENDISSGGATFHMMRWEPKDIYHIGFQDRSFTHYTEFMGKPFLILDSLDTDDWKMTGKQGVILGYPCMEVSSVIEDSVPVLAWFTPRIRVASGPSAYVGFPGLVLFVDIDNGKTTISATKVSMGTLIQEAPEIPDDGEEVSQDEYDAIVKEKTDQARRRSRR